jgi:hypothetical protein
VDKGVGVKNAGRVTVTTPVVIRAGKYDHRDARRERESQKPHRRKTPLTEPVREADISVGLSQLHLTFRVV